MEGSGLSPITSIDGARRRRLPGPLWFGGVVVTLLSAASWCWAASETWALRGDSAFASTWYFVAAVLCVALPIVTIWGFLRLDVGWAMVPPIAFTLTFVVWLSHGAFRFVSHGFSSNA